MDYRKKVEQTDKLLDLYERQRKLMRELRHALILKALDEPDQRLWALKTLLADLVGSKPVFSQMDPRFEKARWLREEIMKCRTS